MIRKFESRGIEDLVDLQPEGWQDIRDFFRFYCGSPFCHPVKISDQGRPVGVGCVILHGDTAWLAHIIVADSHRRRGLGAEITSALMDIGKQHGRSLHLLIATEMGAPLYRRLGFKTTGIYEFHQASAEQTFPLPEPVRPLREGDLPEILRLDRRASGEDRRWLLALCCERGHVWEGAGKNHLRGYFLPDLGEGAIVAETAEAGIDLLKVRRMKGEFKTVLPAGNTAATNFLKESGFELTSGAERMAHGGEDPQDPSMIFQRIGGHLG